jgi:HEAT repeat protein
MEQMKKEENNNPAWMAKLLPLLKDERVRERIALDLLANLSEYKDRNSLAAAIIVIGKVGGAEQVAGLGRLARSHETQGARVRAMYALADIGGAAAARELTAILREQGDVTNTLKAIEKMKGPEIVAELKTLTTADQPEDVRLLGVQALGRTATTKEATEALLAIRKDGGSLARAVDGQLRYVRGRDATAPFLDLIDEEKNVIAKAGMAEALGTNGSEEARTKLRDLLENKDEAQSVRGASAKGLAESGDVRAVKPFKEILADPRPENRLVESKVLQSIGTLAKKNRKAAEELKKEVLPILKKREKEGGMDSNSHWRRIAIVNLESLDRKGPARESPVPERFRNVDRPK